MIASLTQWNDRLLYADTFCLYRYDWIDDEGCRCQQQRTEPELADIPCYLSISKNSLANRRRLDQPGGDDGERNTVERIVMLFCAPHYQIRAGDYLEVHHGGEVFSGVAGEPHRFMWHQELLVYVSGDA
ncbi:MAG: hypothetical protein Q4C00_00590 [Bacillota bacterium]|nr:hypothetical protein [Bacillota bacterium]